MKNEKKTTWVFLYIKYSKFWSVSLERFIERKPLIYEEWISDVNEWSATKLIVRFNLMIWTSSLNKPYGLDQFHFFFIPDFIFFKDCKMPARAIQSALSQKPFGQSSFLLVEWFFKDPHKKSSSNKRIATKAFI